MVVGYDYMTTKSKNLIFLIIFIVISLSLYTPFLHKQGNLGQVEDKKLTTGFVESHNERYEVYQVNNKTTFTAYTLSIDETDKNPCIGSSNHNLCELRKTRQICASRDLPLHTVIYIESIGECEILDRLNVKYLGTNRIDILMETKEQAINFGKRKLNYVIVK